MEIKQVALEIRADDVTDAGIFSGYGSVFGVRDSYGDIIERGAFAGSLDQWRTKGKWPAMLASHGSESMWPVGVYTSMSEDNHGLRVIGQLAMGTTLGREAHELLRMGALDGLSIGFSMQKQDYSWEDRDGKRARIIKRVDLWEVSIVTFPANGAARVESVKTGNVPDKRVIESALRDVCGLTQRQAKALLADGYGAVRDESVDIESKLDRALANLTKLKESKYA